MTTKNDDVLIKVEGLHKIYGDFHALNGINEEIHKGEVVVVVGPSGSGKSTFLRSLNLLEVPDQGHIYFEGVDITDKHVDINKHRQKMEWCSSILIYSRTRRSRKISRLLRSSFLERARKRRIKEQWNFWKE